MNAIQKEAAAGADGPRRGRRPSPEKREALLAAALRLFAERGVDGTATRDIAALAETTERTLFKHFGSKDGLIQAVVERVSLAFTRQSAFARIEDATPFADAAAFRDWHRTFLADRIAAAQRQPDGYRVLFQELLRDARFRDRYAGQWRAGVFEPLRAHLAALQAAGAFGGAHGPDALAGAFFSLNLGYLVGRFALAPGQAWDGAADIEAIVALFATLCGEPPRPPGAA